MLSNAAVVLLCQTQGNSACLPSGGVWELSRAQAQSSRTKKLLQLTPEQLPLHQPVPAAGAGRAWMCFGCRSVILQTPPTARIDSRTKSLTLCHRKSLSSEEFFWDYIHGILIVFGNCRRWKYMAQTCHASEFTAFCSGMPFHRRARFKAALLKYTGK